MSIRGADIVDSVTFPVVPGNHKWEGHGLEISIPEQSVDTNALQKTMTISASISGQYQLPDNTDLISGIYWITCPHKFPEEHPVTLTLQHCATVKNLEQLNSLSFITAKCTQKTLPYEFKELDGGIFSTENCYGSIKLCHFSGIGVKRIKQKEDEKSYVIRTYYISQGANDWLTHIVMVCNLETHLEVWFLV